jgi:hypothetical protein
MKLVVAVLSVIAVAFLFRFLRALRNEAKSALPAAAKVYLLKFNPPRFNELKIRGELIVMNAENRSRKLSIQTGKRIALIILPAVLLILPIQAQQLTSDAPPDAKVTKQPSGAADQPDRAAIEKELAAMKQRIAELETALKAQSAPAAPVQLPAASAPAPASTELATAAVPYAIAPVSTPPISVQTESENAPSKPAKPAKAEPFAFADWTWLNGNSRVKDVPFDTKFFTPEVQADISYIVDFNHPADDSIGGSSEVFRSDEVQLTQLGVGGDFHYDNVRARLMTQFGMYSATTPRNDASPARGQWDLDTAYRYVSEAYGGYHINALHGINVDAGIFMSYIGLFSYYNADNWAYQPSYVSSNTPWFFNGLRVQIFPTEKLKIEPWFINGWQSYGRFNHRPGVGGQILYRPNGKFEILGNQYLLGADTLGVPGRIRYHTDDSIEYKYLDHPDNLLSKAAFSLTGDAGCEHGGDPVAGTAVSCDTDGVRFVNGVKYIAPKQSFLGFMVYNRLWFDRDKFGFTLGGGKINNPGRYLVLLPPINGATAVTGTPYFTENPGDPFKAWDSSATFDYMPSQYITFRWEYDHRAANVPYFTGRGGITPPGGNNGNPSAIVPGWTPDLVKDENRLDLAILVKF